MAPSSRIILVLLGITSAGLALCAALVFGSLDRLSLRSVETNIDFLLSQLRSTIEANVDLGLPLSDMRVVQDLIERAEAGDPQVLALEVFSPSGVSLFNTDRGSVGEPVSPAWMEAIRYRLENDRWRVEELGTIVVGQVIRNDFGEPVGYLAVSLSDEPYQQNAMATLGGLAREMAVALPLSLVVVLIVAAALLKLLTRDIGALTERLLSERHSETVGGGSPLIGKADLALATIEQAIIDFDRAAAEVSRIDEMEDRDAA